jgi:hypothetical protein
MLPQRRHLVSTKMFPTTQAINPCWYKIGHYWTRYRTISTGITHPILLSRLCGWLHPYGINEFLSSATSLQAQCLETRSLTTHPQALLKAYILHNKKQRLQSTSHLQENQERDIADAPPIPYTNLNAQSIPDQARQQPTPSRLARLPTPANETVS